MSPNTTPSASPLNFVRRGAGKPLLMLHGLGGNIASWGDLIDALATTNAVIAVDLPGHGASPVTREAGTFRGIADVIADFIRAEDIIGIDCVGHSLGGRVALEMARRGLVGATVALAPGGFWSAGESRFLKVSLLASGRVARLSRSALPMLTRHAIGRAVLLAQISARPAQVPSELALRELRSFAATPTFDALTRDLADGPVQEGADKTHAPVTIVWGRKDRLLLPRQADRAIAAFPKARLHWIADAGHYIPWDAPDETLRLIRQGIGPQRGPVGPQCPHLKPPLSRVGQTRYSPLRRPVLEQWTPAEGLTRNRQKPETHMTHPHGHPGAAERPVLLVTLATIGVLGSVTVVVGMFVAQAFVPDYNWVSDTISDLAAGEWEIVMDVSLYGFAAGLYAVSLAAAHAHLGTLGWSVGIFSFAGLAALVVIIGARNEYGDNDNEGVVIHIYLVYMLGALFALAPLCMAGALRADHRWASNALIGLAAAWAVLCPVFLLAATSIDGVIERVLGLIACAMVWTLCVVFYQRGRHTGRHGQ